MLFTERSIWTMIHGIGLGGAALLSLAAALVALYLLRAGDDAVTSRLHSRTTAILTSIVAIMLWLTSLGGMFMVFPDYRATPPEGTVDLTQYPRSLVLSDPETAWLHAFGMETKEHLPWIAVMLATAVAFIAWRAGSGRLIDRNVRGISFIFLGICLVIVSYVSLLGVFVNKVAPLF